MMGKIINDWKDTRISELYCNAQMGKQEKDIKER